MGQPYQTTGFWLESEQRGRIKVIIDVLLGFRQFFNLIGDFFIIIKSMLANPCGKLERLVS